MIAKTAGRGSDDVRIVFAPFDKKFGLRPLQAQADIVLIPHTDPAYNNPQILRGTPIIIDLPGEYAVKGVNIIGFDAPADLHEGQERGNTIVFIVDVEGMKVVYLGALGGTLTPDQLDLVSGADVLFVPVGDKEGLDGKSAETLARQIEAKLIIPMHYATKGLKNLSLRDTTDFCSNIGNCPAEAEEKIVVKSADIADKKMDVHLLEVS